MAQGRDIVGLKLNPPERAVVLRVDEKAQIQALGRTQPGLSERRTHDYPRPDRAVRPAGLRDRPGDRQMLPVASGGIASARVLDQQAEGDWSW